MHRTDAAQSTKKKVQCILITVTLPSPDNFKKYRAELLKNVTTNVVLEQVLGGRAAIEGFTPFSYFRTIQIFDFSPVTPIPQISPPSPVLVDDSLGKEKQLHTDDRGEIWGCHKWGVQGP